MRKQVHVDFRKIHETARKGILRAAVFLGLGVNASEREDLRDYQLSKHTNFRLLPESVASGVVDGWKQEFRIWIVGCGFRELVDRLCVFLDQIYRASALIARDYSAKEQSDFEWMGLDRKIRKLGSKYGIRFRHSDLLTTFYPVRNCFAHRLGRVGREDIRGKKSLDLRFMRYATILSKDGGEELALPDLFDPSSTQFAIPADGNLALKWTEECLLFGEGELIRLSPKALTEILFFAHICAINVTQAATEFAIAKGAVVKDPEA